MKAFLIELEDRPGSAAQVFEIIAERGINITAVGGGSAAGKGALALLTNDEAGTRSALEAGGIQAREVDILSVTLRHEPGTLATATRRLADAGVSLQLLLPTGMSGSEVSVALGVDNLEAAREALGELVSAGA